MSTDFWDVDFWVWCQQFFGVLCQQILGCNVNKLLTTGNLQSGFGDTKWFSLYNIINKVQNANTDYTGEKNQKNQWHNKNAQAISYTKVINSCSLIFLWYSPYYMSGLLPVYTPSRQLHSSSDLRTQRIPHFKTKTSGHCFFPPMMLLLSTVPCLVNFRHI